MRGKISPLSVSRLPVKSTLHLCNVTVAKTHETNVKKTIADGKIQDLRVKARTEGYWAP